MRSSRLKVKAFAIIEDNELLIIDSTKQFCVYETRAMAKKEIDVERRKSESIVEVSITLTQPVGRKG